MEVASIREYKFFGDNITFKVVKKSDIGGLECQVMSMYGGSLEFIFVVESIEDPAHESITQLINEFKVGMHPYILVRELYDRMCLGCTQTFECKYFITVWRASSIAEEISSIIG